MTQHFGLFTSLLLLLVGLCSCASQEISVEFLLDNDDMKKPSVSVDVMILDTEDSDQNKLSGEFDQFENRKNWFLETSSAYNELRTTLSKAGKYHRVLIDKNTKKVPTKILKVGKKRESAKLLAVMMVNDSEKPVDEVSIEGKNHFQVKIKENMVVVKVKDP